MMTKQKLLISLGAIVIVPCAAAAGWWYYWPTYRLHQAETALTAGNLAQADQILKELARPNPAQPRIYLLDAQVLRRLTQPAAAQRTLHRAMKLGLSEAEGRREFALAEAVKQFSPNAERNLLTVLKERPGDEEIVRALAAGYAG